jgi:hypothetical protein
MVHFSPNSATGTVVDTSCTILTAAYNYLLKMQVVMCHHRFRPVDGLLSED